MQLRHALLFTALMSSTLVGVAPAQHDPHRNAVQAIALGDFEKAGKQLNKAKPDDPETRFVRVLQLLKQGDVPAANAAVQDALDAGLPFSRFVAGPRELLDPLRGTPAFRRLADEQTTPVLVHGPMVGSVTDTTAAFWVRTAAAADLQIRIGEQESAVETTSRESDFTAVATVDGLKPSTEYTYRVFISGKQVEADNTQFRTFATAGAPAKFSVVFGGGAGYVPKWERMWTTIAKQRPHALLMLGDNVYIDQPEHTLCQHYCYYRRQARPEWRSLAASTPTYAIYDDHDFGTNDCVPGPEIETPTWKRSVWNIFRQNWVNPSYGGGPSQPGCWHDFHIGDVHFILLDGRYYRDRQGGSMLGPVQKAWLLETLNQSTATFKILASPVPWTAGIKPGSRDPWDGFPEEREEIFSFIETNGIDGVVLIAADRHRTDLRKTARPSGYDLYEFESSRLTNRHTRKIVQTPGLIWGYNDQCSFARMYFNTTRSNPTVRFECWNIDGELIHAYTLAASELRTK